MSAAADLIRLGLVVVPHAFDKAPGINAEAAGLTLEQLENRQQSGYPDRFCVVVGRTDIGLRSGVVDVETDCDKDTGEMAGEASLVAAGIPLPPGPWMQTPSGSKHRLFRLAVPEGMEVNIGPGLLPKVDVPWQFHAVDEDLRTWHDLHLPIPEAPAKLRSLLLRPKPQRAAVEHSAWEGDGYGSPSALAFLDTYCDKLRTAPDGAWNNTLFLAARWAAELVAGGTLDADFARDRIFSAMADPDERAAVSTFESGWKKGLENPRRLAEDLRKRPIGGDSDGLGTRFRLTELMGATLGETQWVVPDLLPAGLALLAGPPKLGKSWMVLDIALSVAAGRSVLGRRVAQGDVLYLALEDNPRRLQGRARIVLGQTPVPQGLEMWTRAGKLDGDLVPEIEEWLDAQEAPRLVIIDTLGRVQGTSAWVDAKDGGYADAVEALAGLQDMAAERHVAVVVITHTKKGGWGKDQDPLEAVLGSQGYAGTADAVLVLKRERGQANGELFVTGREVDEELTEAVWFDKETCRWIAGDQDYPTIEDQVLDFLEHRDKKGEYEYAWTLTAEGVAHAMHRRRADVEVALDGLEASGQVSSKPRPGRGRPGKLWGPAAVLPPGLANTVPKAS